MQLLRSTPARRVARGRRRGTHSGQTLVEFAIVSPLLLFIVFALIDVGRLVYAYNAISSASREGARLVALQPQLTSDCDPLKRMQTVANGFSLSQDPDSIKDSTKNVDPNSNPGAGTGPTKPSAGTGYMYIFPAIAQSTTPTTGCAAASGNTRPCPPPQSSVKDVAVEIQYNFQPLTPLLNQLFTGVDVKTISETPADYC